MKKTFMQRWAQIIENAKKSDEDIEPQTGFKSFLPFVAVLLGWIPALMGEPKEKDIDQKSDKT